MSAQHSIILRSCIILIFGVWCCCIEISSSSIHVMNTVLTRGVQTFTCQYMHPDLDNSYWKTSGVKILSQRQIAATSTLLGGKPPETQLVSKLILPEVMPQLCPFCLYNVLQGGYDNNRHTALSPEGMVISRNYFGAVDSEFPKLSSNKRP